MGETTTTGIRVAAIVAVLASSLTTSAAHAQTAAPKPAPPATDAASTQPEPPPWNPAVEADPPLLPAPAGLGPLSTSGSDVRDDGARASVDPAKERALEARVAALEAKLAQKKRVPDTSPWGLWRHLKIGGFVQPQLLVQSVNAAASPNQIGGSLPPGISANDVIAQADGTTTNGTFFRLRRTRLRTTYETDAMRFYVQIEALPMTGEAPQPSTIVRNAEATGKIHWTDDALTEVTAGLFMVPFRYELTETSNVRPFVERTAFAQNAFPLERDLGVHVKTTALGQRLTVDLALVNGQRLGEGKFVVLPDLNPSKDFVGWASYAIGPVLLGFNGYIGRGQAIDGANLRFKQFDRWALNVFAQAKGTLVPVLGETRVISELTFGTNMDTGVRYATGLPAIPTTFTANVTSTRQRAFYARLEQELGDVALVGYRYDVYVPDYELKENGRDTHTFLAGARFSQNLRWTNELSLVTDEVHAPGTLPPGRRLLALSSVLQAQF